jgi:hypothetical protein
MLMRIGGSPTPGSEFWPALASKDHALTLAVSHRSSKNQGFPKDLPLLAERLANSLFPLTAASKTSSSRQPRHRRAIRPAADSPLNGVGAPDHLRERAR